MTRHSASLRGLYILLILLSGTSLIGQCPLIPDSDVDDHTMMLCPGDMLTMSATGENLPLGSTVDWYVTQGTENPYDGEGVLIGSGMVNDPNGVIVEDFVWTIPDDFCDVFPGSGYAIVGLPNPPPVDPCLEVLTPYYGFQVSCTTIELTGGGDVCEGDCPEAPTEIVFSIDGNDGPYTVDIEVSATLFGTFPIDDLEVSDGEVLYICLEGVFPSFDPATNTLNVPVLAIGFMASVEIVSAVSASGCPVDLDQNAITLHFIESPTSFLSGDESICAGESVELDGSIGGSAETFEWSTNGDGGFSDPNSLETMYIPGDGDITSGSVLITLFSMDQNSSCIPGESSILVNIEPSLTIEVNTPLTICDNDVANVIAMLTGSSVECIWETDGDGTFDDPAATNTFYNPGFFDIQNGQVTLYYNPVDPDACVQSNEPLQLTIVPAPEVDIPQDLEICEGDIVVISIDVSGDYSSINWSYPGDGMLVVDDDFNVTYTPGPMDIDNQFFVVSVSIVSAFPACGEITYNIPVYVVLCDCPDFETVAPSTPLCFADDTLNLDDILIAGGSGMWTITQVPPGANPATISGDLFITDMADPGTYTVTYTLNFPEPGCPATQSEEVLVIGATMADAGMDVAFCGYQSVSLNGMMDPPGLHPVQWESTGDGFFTDPMSLSTTYILGAGDSLSAQLDLVLHVLDTVCESVTDTITLYFRQPPVTTFVNDTILVCNMPENGSVINFNALITGGDSMGVWSNPFGVPVDFSMIDSVDFDGLAEGFYMFQYETNSAMSPCSETVYTIVVSVEECDCPFLMISNAPEGICNSLPSLPLDPFIQSGGPGTWSVISTPPGGNPATVSGSFLTIGGADPGVYGLRFTLDAAPLTGCPDSAEFLVTIQEPALLSISNDTSICGMENLQSAAVTGGSAIGVAWISSGTGMFDDTSALQPVYTPSQMDVMSGTVLLIAEAVDTFGFCPVERDTIELTIQTPPFATFSALSDTLCNHPDSITIINLMSFISAGDNSGVWTDVDGAGVDLTDPTIVDFESVIAGTYTFGYETQSAVLPCTDSMYTFTVVVEDCACPALLIENQMLQFCEGDSFNLADLVINADPGTWSIISGPFGFWPDITGSMMWTNGATGGSYQIEYRLNDSVPDCPASLTIPMEINLPPTYSITNITCDPDHIYYEVIIETDAASVMSDFGIVTPLGSDGFSIDSIDAGQNVQLDLVSSSGCSVAIGITAPDCDCTLFIEDIADTLYFCPGDTFVLIPFVTGAQGLPFSTWYTPSGTIMWPTLALTQEGQYIWQVVDEAGCEERDTFHVSFSGPVITEWTINPQRCPEIANGSISIDEIHAGSPPFVITVNNGAPDSFTNTPYHIENLAAGNYYVMLTDNSGCTTSELINVYTFGIGALEIGPDRTIQKGDSVFIQPYADEISIMSVTWDPPLLNTGIEDFWYTPDVTTLLSVIVEDTSGCVYTDELLISVFEAERFYIPNIFSPNQDGINDVFEIVTNLPDEFLLSLEIFDRWGNMIHQQNSLPPFQWDGTFKNEAMQSGVYVYRITWKNQDGDVKTKAGDVTLLR